MKTKFKRFVPLVPGVFTVGNMICGFTSILHSTSGKIVSAAWLIILGAFFDLLDGKVARLTSASSEMGVELDSLADFLTFGISPGILLFSLGIYNMKNWGFVIPILFLLAGSFRLARYNITADPHYKSDFQGLPIPLAAGFVASYILFSYSIWSKIEYTQFFTPSLVLLSWLMISNVRYPSSPKFVVIRKLPWRVLALSLPVVAILIKPRWFLFPVIFLYILHGFIRELYWTVMGVEKEEKDEIQDRDCGSS